MTTWAGPTDLPQMSTDSDIKLYTIKKANNPSKHATYTKDNAANALFDMNGANNVNAVSFASYFYFTGSVTDGVATVKIHNLAAGSKKFATSNTWTDAGSDWYIASKTENGVSISKNADFSGNNSWNDYQGSGYLVDYWSASDGGSQWIIEAVDVSVEAIDSVKTATIAKVESLANVTCLFPAKDNYIAQIEAIANNGGAASLKAVAEVLFSYVKTVNNMSVKLVNNGSGERYGRFLGYDATNNRPAGVSNDDNGALWTLDVVGGEFVKLYNMFNNIYIGSPADTTPRETNYNNATSYKVIPTAENRVALVASNGNMLHLANHTNYKLISHYSLTDGASLWDVTLVGEVVSREKYNKDKIDNVNAFAQAVQGAYGLVTDASKYFSNYKSTAEGSYEALLDKSYANASYFHSAYNDEPGDGTGVHYIRADFGKAVNGFYFYMAPRAGNGNNRPVNITVSGSNNDTDYEEIGTVTTTLDGTMTPYISAKLGEKEYQYIRLTVTSTNSGSKFFTLSELYFFPASDDVNTLMESYEAFKNASVVATEWNVKAQALLEVERTLATANIKKEVAAILAANEENHADEPAYGQYTTTAYNALATALAAGDATLESLEAAIAVFNKAKNAPAYIITSAWNGGYSKGSAIYYDGAWKWKTADRFNKQMWMTIPAHNADAAPVVDAYDANGTSYAINDYLTGHTMRDVKVQIVKIDNWDGAYNLQYNANANSTNAAQHAQSGGALVSWKPAVVDNCQASAWNIEFIGSTYELDNLTITDEQIAALNALQTAYNAKAPYAELFGNALGQYSGDKDAFLAALAGAKAIVKATIVEQAKKSVDEINAAKTALDNAPALTLNMPVAGKYYRIRCTDGNNRYLSSNTNDAGRMLTTLSTDQSNIFYYTNGGLLSYNRGVYIHAESSSNQVKLRDVAQTSTAEFIDGKDNNKPGSYLINIKNSGDNGNGRYIHGLNETTDSGKDKPTNGTHSGYTWWLEEVTELPVAITAAGYASFYAPVAVTVPSGIEAHYLTNIIGKFASMTKIESGIIPANTGVMLTGTDGKPATEGTYNLAITINDVSINNNMFKGTIATEYVTGNAYVLAIKDNNVGLYSVTLNKENETAFQNNSHKAYLPAGTSTMQNSAGFRFSFGGTTAIEEVETESENVKAIYDLTGRKLSEITKPGIYIIDGKKVLVK